MVPHRPLACKDTDILPQGYVEVERNLVAVWSIFSSGRYMRVTCLPTQCRRLWPHHALQHLENLAVAAQVLQVGSPS